MNIAEDRGVWIIGAGGHAKVVIATLQAAKITPRGIFDDDPVHKGRSLFGVPILGPLPSVSSFAPEDRQVVIAIGANGSRKKIAEKNTGLNWMSVIHPAAIVHNSASIGAGTVIFAGCVIQPDTKIGSHVILNTGAQVDHDGRVGDYCHIAPGCALAGNVTLGEGTFIGVGASIGPGWHVGAWTTIGAGATVTCDIPPGVTAVGVPARALDQERSKQQLP